MIKGSPVTACGDDDRCKVCRGAKNPPALLKQKLLALMVLGRQRVFIENKGRIPFAEPRLIASAGTRLM